MSVFATAWAYEQPVDNSGAKFVLVALANFADADGYCYPGQHTLARMTSLDERTVRKHLKRLEAEGFIRRGRAYDEKGHRTSDDIHLLAPPERIRPAGSQTEDSSGRQGSYRKKTARPYRKKTPPEKSPAYPSIDKAEPSVVEPPSCEAQPAASPRGGDGGTQAGSEHREGMTYLHERCGPIPDPSAQGAALKWLLAHYPLEQCCSCLDDLLQDDWRKTAVSWLTVKQEIGTWLARKENAHGSNGRPEEGGGRDHEQARRREPTRHERRVAELRRQDPATILGQARP